MLTVNLLTDKSCGCSSETKAIMTTVFTLARLVQQKLITSVQAQQQTSELLGVYFGGELSDAFDCILGMEDQASAVGDQDAEATLRLMNDFVSPLF